MLLFDYHDEKVQKNERRIHMKKHSNHMKLAAWILSLMMLVSILPAAQVNAATKKIKISQTKVILTVGKTKTLSLKNVSKKQKKKIKWTSSKKSVATVSKSGKVKAKKAGTATITAKLGRKKYKCKVTVKKKATKKKSSKKKIECIDDEKDRDLWGYKMKHNEAYYQQKRASIYKQLGITKATKPQYAAFLLAKWECDHIRYDDETDLPGQSYQQAFDKGYVVCGGYANLYKYLLEGIGIPVRAVLTNDNLHEWDQVKIDGKWYAVDVTGMDQGDSVHSSNDESLRYDMTQFLMPDKYLVLSQGENHGATDKRFVPVIYDAIVAYNNDFGGTLDADGDLIREYVDSDGVTVIQGATNYLKYWNSKKEFIGKFIRSGVREFEEPDYRFNPWFTGQWQSY